VKTRTGAFPIGFRRSRSEWQTDPAALAAWSQAHDISVVDLGRDAPDSLQVFAEAGMRIGSIDLLAWQPMISSDKGQRAEAVAQNAEYIAKCGAANYFLVMLPQDPALPRAENFRYMIESFGALIPALEANNARLAIEGWPGPGALCCTPEAFRALFQELPSPAVGINYDPSHLIRQGIDPLRFLDEFGGRVYHIHGKDTELLSENLYVYGSEQPATFAQRIRFGAHAWRYTIPGQGCMRWGQAFSMLESLGYQGCVSIELEDANFNGTNEGEQMGILHGVHFLAGC
jgi:sugar phosphate isomerase/epimerase